MGNKFNKINIILKAGQSLIEATRKAIYERKATDKIEAETFSIDDVTIISIDGEKVEPEVEYQYGW